MLGHKMESARGSPTGRGAGTMTIAAAPRQKKGEEVREPLHLKRYFTKEGRHPYDEIAWELRNAVIPGEKGPVFEQKGVEVPAFWSQTATNVVASKYFRGILGSDQREWSVKQMIDRVAKTIANWGRAGHYFATDRDAAIFEDELTWLLVNQHMAFNSPVWFNVGASGDRAPQSSACFILSVDDEMESILEWFKTEGMIFKGGSGSGLNVSSLRSSKEHLSGGGYASREGKPWALKAVKTGEAVETVDPRELLREISQAAWECGDPGMQFDTTFNDWHTIPNSGRINATNPCSEFATVDNSACNLASLNLMRFLDADGEFDVEKFRRAVQITITAQEIIVGNSSYPSPKIDRNAKAQRQLGIGYANLGAVLMQRGLPYDSDEGRAYAAAITAALTGEAYAQSARIAANSAIGPFEDYAKNREPMLRVIGKHREAAYEMPGDQVPASLLSAARQAWDDALTLGGVYGFRNAQASLLAPTGTISFLLDCDTTGIEPDIALVKYKKLVGGGTLKLVNGTVPAALRQLGYTDTQVDAITAFITAEGTIEGAPNMRPEHLAVFDCAFKAAKGERYISHMGHIRMMGAVQPFLSGAISKTVNLPETATVEDVMDAYVQAWKHGVKAIAIYRDGSKKVQPVNTSAKEANSKA